MVYNGTKDKDKIGFSRFEGKRFWGLRGSFRRHVVVAVVAEPRFPDVRRGRFIVGQDVSAVRGLLDPS